MAMQRLSDLEAAELCQKAYDGHPEDWFEFVTVNGIAAGVIQRDGGTIVAFRGSANKEDWLRDLDERPEDHPDLGKVHAGFLEGMEAAYNVLLPLLRGQQVQLTGHSLGAAHACLLAGLLAARGRSPARLALFGCPRPGFDRLRDLVLGAVPDITSYRNREDPVPLVPYLMGLYHHVVEPMAVRSRENDIGPVDDHFIAHYVDAMRQSGS